MEGKTPYFVKGLTVIHSHSQFTCGQFPGFYFESSFAANETAHVFFVVSCHLAHCCSYLVATPCREEQGVQSSAIVQGLTVRSYMH